MALKDLLALADDKLHSVFAQKPYDPAKERAAMIKRIDKTLEQYKAKEPPKGKKWFKIQNGVAQVTLPFEIGGKSTFHVPGERFADWLGHLKASVTGGELDDAIKQPTSSKPATTRAPSSRAGKPMDPVTSYARNIKKFGQERADALLDQKNPQGAAEVRAAFKAKQ